MAAAEQHHEAGDGTEARVAVARTGSAEAASGATAVTGYRGPGPIAGAGPASVRVSGSGDATASQGGLANTGYVDTMNVGRLTVVQERAPRAPAVWPHQVGVLPLRAQSFQLRAETEWLWAVAGEGGTTVLGQVLSGMGGVGKTQLAAEYARTAWNHGSGDRLDVLVWVTAGSRTAIVDAYGQAGVELCGAAPDNPKQAADTFLAWLTPKTGATPCRWLIVLDDVADPDDLRGMWPPASPHGTTLVTTRRRDAALGGEGRHRIEVGLFSPGEALAYLTAALAGHGRTEPAAQLGALAAELGHLPLALAQAAAYLIDSGETVTSYRALLADRSTPLADTAPDRLPDDQTHPLAAAWALSLDRADTLAPAGLARPMLRLASLLDANGIPQTVLTSAPSLTHLAAHRTRTGPTPAEEPNPLSERDAVRALRALHRLHLIDHTPGTPHQAVRVHQLIQRTTRDTLTPTERDQLARTAADALLSTWPDIERESALVQTLRANASALTSHTEDALYQPDMHMVLERAGNSLGNSGQVTAAAEHFQHLATSTRSRLGPDHPHTLASRHNLAFWQGQAGDAAGAAAALAELLDDRVRVLGKDHPHVLFTRHSLASCRGRAGDAVGAAADFAAVVDDHARVLGKDHPHTLSTRHELAFWRGRTNDGAGAAAAFAELLEAMVRVRGEHHPQTLTTRSNLAYWQGRAGDAAGAVAAFTELLNDHVQVLGEDHPDTLSTRHELAFWRGEAGDAAGAAAALATLLEDRIRVLGEDHPHVLSNRKTLALWRGRAGDTPGATAAFAELLEVVVRIRGQNHPQTLALQHEITRWQIQARHTAVDESTE
ncbi:tetratricopeptide repeat protein [Streptomyces sp. NPDC058739]|uniref:tetratricopeptide repeat protein n=1 Tax=Streptomyces sp. NPDC058739 TaxID=3346618 RepID=UPI0036A8E3E9